MTSIGLSQINMSMDFEQIILNIKTWSVKESMAALAAFIDQAADALDNASTKQALELCELLEPTLAEEQIVELCYFKANIWSTLRLVEHQTQANIWEWEQVELLNEVFWLRTAIRSEFFEKLNKIRQCQILVNTGNILNHIGRPIEAIEYWRRALDILPTFAMAMANLGMGLETYAKTLYDPGHATVIFKAAYDLLMRITADDVVWDNQYHLKIRESIVERAELISLHFDFSGLEGFHLDGFSLGKSKSEKSYKAWALNNRLFLNPLNDMTFSSIAAQDVLHLPSMVCEVGMPPNLIGFYNQIKQEFVSARYILWQGITELNKYKQHFSDIDNLLIDTLDYPNFGLGLEQVKLSFRSAFSLLDKIAYFINDYWRLNIPETKINFQSVWYEFNAGNKTKNINKIFENHDNLILRGLYWLSKDFIEQDKNSHVLLGSTMEPDADKLRTIRNHLEHKYLKVHDEIWNYTKNFRSYDPFYDSKAYHLCQSELVDKAMRIVKLSRAAIIYLSLAVNREEIINAKNNLAIPMELSIYSRY